MNAPERIQDADLTVEGALSDDFFLGGEESVQPERSVLGRVELLARLSALLQSCEGCEPVAVVGIARLDPPDATGCNWSSTLLLDPRGVAPEVYALGYADVILSARACWNLQ